MQHLSKRTRAKGRKVRTGCKTCKTRHLKCDETKPHCYRCQKHGFACEGYPVIPRYRSNKQKRISEAQGRRMVPVVEKGAISIHFPGLTSSISPMPPEVELLHHVRTCTVEDFRMTIVSTEFWDVHALPLGYTVQPIQSALCALGGADRLFKSGRLKPGCPLSQTKEATCIKEYNRAIEHIRSMAGVPSEATMEIVLTCCVIFICVENLLGRYSESLRHLRAGCLLLASFRKLYIDDARRMPTNDKAVFYDNVKAILHGLGRDVADYMGVELFPALSLVVEPASQVPDKTAFKSAAAAAKALLQFESEYSRRLHQAQHPRACETEQDTSCNDGLASLVDGASWSLQLERPELDVVKKTFWHWDERFEMLKSQVDERGSSKQEFHQIKLLSLRQAWWSAAVEMRSFDEVVSQGACETILKEAQAAIGSQPLASPTFTLYGRVIPAVAMVYSSCGDWEIKKRCLAILRSMRSREGVWDSQEIADILESISTAAQENLISWEALPWKVPLLAEMASTLQIPRIHISSGALSLSNLDPENSKWLQRYPIRLKHSLDNPADG